MTRARLALALTPAVAAALAGCFTREPTVAGPARCTDSPAQPGALGCALIFGTVVGPSGAGLDGIEAEMRPDLGCTCRATLQVDELGRFSTTVRRYPSASSVATRDSGVVTLVVRAAAEKYPRHSTGAAYFDTARVTLHFAPTGEVAPLPVTVAMRIPLP